MTIDLTEQQLSQILQTLAQRPYAEVFDLMQNIQRQAQAQVSQRPPQTVQANGHDAGQQALTQ